MAETKWQPVMLILDRRLECKCGAMGIFVTGTISDDEPTDGILDDVGVWCQDCFTKAQEAGEDEHEYK